jgi:glucose-6-phosphate 1-epimerase
LVRARRWREAGRSTFGGEQELTLTPELDPPLRALWPRPFRLEFTVTLGDDRIALELAVSNVGGEPLEFTAALHGYFAVDDVERASVIGLRGVEYRDAADRDARRVEREEVVAIRGEVDRVYHDVPGPVELWEPGRSLRIEAAGFPDVVVWNPGAERCAALPDMAPGGWRRMLCVEAGAIQRPVVLPAATSWRARQALIELAA